MIGELYYFSGTGNTKWVADRFREVFKGLGNSIELVNIENVDKLEIEHMEKNDFLILAFPVYAEMPPKIYLDFINKIPDVKDNKRCIVYSTQGSKMAAATGKVRKILENKGFKVAIETSFYMTNNYYFGVGKKPSKELEKRLLENASKHVEEVSNIFIENKEFRKTASPLRVGIGNTMSKALINRLPKMSKNLTSVDECVKCGICLRNCPKNNITFEDGHAIFHSNCMLCLRCIHICPINAVRYKNKKIEQTQKERINSLTIKK